jgi:uncharacterized tellurite resistance protein B-like protein
MSLFRRVLNLDETPTSPDATVDAGAPLAPVDPAKPLPDLTTGMTASVKSIAAQLTELPPARARYIAAFAYVMGRAANATGSVSDDERAVMLALAETGGLDPEHAPLIVDLAATLSGEFGATEDFLVAREFKAISTMEEREQLLRCCFLVMAADDEIDATESWLANRLAEELDVVRPDLNAIRAEFHEQLSGVKELRRLQAS